MKFTVQYMDERGRLHSKMCFGIPEMMRLVNWVAVTEGLDLVYLGKAI